MGRKLYGKGIVPMCAYCAKGTLSSDKKNVLCIKKGIVELNYSCRRFKYDPLLRIPKIPQEIEKFKIEDFKIDE